MIIKNRRDIGGSTLRQQVLDILEAGVSRVLPENLINTAIQIDPASGALTVLDEKFTFQGGRLFVVGGGKASGLMAEAIEKVISPDLITAGMVTCKAPPDQFKIGKIKIYQAGHPLPDQRGIAAVQRMLALKNEYSIGENDLILCLISGGGSALMPCPADGINLKDIQDITSVLLASGAQIHEINTIRKHLSKTAGGGMARHFAPARLVSLILSDVIGNDLNVIASGPTHPDPSTFGEALGVLEKYRLTQKTPTAVIEYLKKGIAGVIPETPKKLVNSHNFIIGDNRLALEAMAGKARELGRKPVIITSELAGDSGAAAINTADDIIRGKYPGYNCIIQGGETTPSLPANHGRGGRNQHYAAVTLQKMAQYPGQWAAASLGTDGSDFLPDVAGAIVDVSSVEMARGIKLNDYVNRFDSNTLFKKMGNSLIITGETGTNVCDVMVYLLGG